MTTHHPPTRDEFDADGRTCAAVAVVRAIAAATDRPAEELSPLYDSVDPDAIDALCDHAREKSTALAVAFSHDGVDVDLRVSPDGEFTVDVGCQ